MKPSGCGLCAGSSPRSKDGPGPVPTPNPKGKDRFRPVTPGCLPVPQLAGSWQDPVGVKMREGIRAEGAPATCVQSA